MSERWREVSVAALRLSESPPVGREMVGEGEGIFWQCKDVKSTTCICDRNQRDRRSCSKWKLRCPKSFDVEESIVSRGQNLNISWYMSFLICVRVTVCEKCYRLWEVRKKRRGITEGPAGRNIESWGWRPPVGTRTERRRRGIRKRKE